MTENSHISCQGIYAEKLLFPWRKRVSTTGQLFPFLFDQMCQAVYITLPTVLIKFHCPYQVPVSLSGSTFQLRIIRSDILRYIYFSNSFCVLQAHIFNSLSAKYFLCFRELLRVMWARSCLLQRWFLWQNLKPPGFLSLCCRVHHSPCSHAFLLFFWRFPLPGCRSCNNFCWQGSFSWRRCFP